MCKDGVRMTSEYRCETCKETDCRYHLDWLDEDMDFDERLSYNHIHFFTKTHGCASHSALKIEGIHDKNRIAQLIVDLKAIKTGETDLRSGEKSPFYIDIKSAATNPDLLYLIAYEVMKKYNFDAVAGVATGGIPLAVAVSILSKKPYAIIRSAREIETRSHGKKDVIIGDVVDKNVLLIEDVTTSGGTAAYGVQELRKAGAKVDQVVSVVDREQGAAGLLKVLGVGLHPIVIMSELCQKQVW